MEIFGQWYARNFGYWTHERFSQTDFPPWRLYKDKINNIFVGSKHIGSYAFTEYPKVKSVFILGTVTSTGKYAFANCTKLNYAFFERKKIWIQIMIKKYLLIALLKK